MLMQTIHVRPPTAKAATPSALRLEVASTHNAQLELHERETTDINNFNRDNET